MRRAALLGGVVSLFVLLPVTVAMGAGTYSVLACSQALHGENNSWQEFSSDPAHLSTGQVCPPQAGSGEPVKSTGMFATDQLGSTSNAPDGSIAGWRFTAPPGTTIVGLQDDRYIGIYSDNGWTPFLRADNSVLETCMFAFPEESCAVGAPFGVTSLDASIPVNEASTLTVGIECHASTGCTEGATLHRAWAALYGARVTLSEKAPPSIVSPSGSLWGPGPASGFHQGVEQVSFQASDLSGIAKATVSVDGNVMATQEGVCDYSQPLPCKPLSAALQVDTTHLVDGPHGIAIDAYDAAGNDVQLTGQIVVANQPPLAPMGLKSATQPDGSFVVSWSSPPDVTPIAGAVYQLCSANGASCVTPVAVGNAPFALPPSTGGDVVHVWLVDAAGNRNAGNAASVVLPATATKVVSCSCLVMKPLPKLRARGSVRDRRLTVSAILPAGVSGPVHISVEVFRGKKRAVGLGARVGVKRGRATAVFGFPHRLAGVVRLAIKVSAVGARSSALSVVVRLPVFRRARG